MTLRVGAQSGAIGGAAGGVVAGAAGGVVAGAESGAIGGVTRLRSVEDGERQARLALSWLAEPGDDRLSDLVGQFGAQRVLTAVAEGRLGAATARHWSARLASLDVDVLLRRAGEVGARFLVPGDPGWPAALTDLGRLGGAEGLADHAPPLGLWVRGQGDLAALAERSVSVVGARAASGYGEQVANEVCGELGERGWTTVSGAAYGIDAAAHRGCLGAGWPTIAVLACGVDIDYPLGNAGLLDKISRNGLVISELAPGTRPTRVRFLRRNRVIAALGQATVVVEAAYRSGALSTARLARGLLRHVGAVPGPVTSSTSQGCLQLLREPGVTLIRRAADVLELVGELGTDAVVDPAGPVTELDRLAPVPRRVLEAVPKVRAADAASISRVAGLDLPEVQAALVQLEIDGLVHRDDAGWCKVRPPRGGA